MTTKDTKDLTKVWMVHCRKCGVMMSLHDWERHIKQCGKNEHSTIQNAGGRESSTEKAE